MTLDRALPFGDLLRRLRVDAGLTQEQLAERAGLSTRGISDLERGVKRAPRRDTLDLLATALGLPREERAALESALRGHAAPARRAPRTPERGAGLDAGGASSPFVGRAAEMRLVQHHLDNIGPPVLLVAGEPGIGKSRLLAETARLASARGWTVLQGGCQRRGGQQPYAPLLGALERHIAALSRAHLRVALRGCAWLVRLLPELAAAPIEPLPAWSPSPEHERRLVIAAVTRFLSNVAGPRGTLLALDDLQWAGSDALDLLHALVATDSHAPAPVRVVGAYRDTEVGPSTPLAATLADLAQAGLVAQHTLMPLAAAAAADLLDALLEGAHGDKATRERVIQRAAGIPFFLVSWAQGLYSGAIGGDGAENLPWTLAQSLRQRLAALPPAAQDVLGVAAVIGRHFDHALLAEAGPHHERDVVVALDVACRARIVVPEDGDGYQFAHDVIREVIEADLGPARRALIHRQVADALERGASPPDPTAIAYHYGRCGLQDKAARYLDQAGDQARAEHAYTAARSYYRDAITRLDVLGRKVEAARLREKLGDVLRVSAAYDQALPVLEEAAGAYRDARDLDRLGRVTARIGRLHSARGTPTEGIARIQPILPALDAAGATHSLAALYTALAHLYFVSGRFSEQLASSERAAELAREAGDEAILADAEGRRGLALLSIELVDAAIPVLDEAARMAMAVDDLTSLCHALNNLARAYLMHGEFTRAMDYQQQALDVADRLGDPTQTTYSRAQRCLILYYTGEWRSARQDCERALTESGRVGFSWASVAAPLTLGLLRLAAGEWAEASHYLGEGAAMARRSAGVYAWEWAQSMLAEHDLMRGHAARAHERLTTLLRDPEARERVAMPWVPTCLARTYLELGDAEKALRAVSTAETRARAGGARVDLARALWVLGMVETRRRHFREAAAALDEALSLAREIGYGHVEARALRALGLLFLAQGDRKSAAGHLRMAYDQFLALGARAEAEQAGAELLSISQNSPLSPAHFSVTDEQWGLIQAFLPAPPRTGRPRADDRRTLEAILYVQRTGCSWAELPPAYGNDATAHRRWRQWQAQGIWEHITAILSHGGDVDDARHGDTETRREHGEGKVTGR